MTSSKMKKDTKDYLNLIDLTKTVDSFLQFFCIVEIYDEQ